MPEPVSSLRAEHAAGTRAALLHAARGLFVAKGYAATSTEDVVAAARVTRGALYHHFRDKKDLFRAVMNDVAADIVKRLVGDALDAADETPGTLLDQLREGVGAFLDICVDGDFQRVVLVDGPTVLGPEAWEELTHRYGVSLLTEWLQQAMKSEEIDELPAGDLARLLVALLTEASLMIGRAADPHRTRRDAGRTLDRIIVGLRRQ
ncbi:MAG TPA: TetR/AcrR family transcriptional regulator [Jatrophihabitantaceae bacterium]|nr:TetR/AcrR family transcriptional regulator [Jatrophihabitantaceae bacterium]